MWASGHNGGYAARRTGNEPTREGAMAAFASLGGVVLLAPYDGLCVRFRVRREEWLRSGALTAPSSVARSC